MVYSFTWESSLLPSSAILLSLEECPIQCEVRLSEGISGILRKLQYPAKKTERDFYLFNI
jgi:hypothetical protein